MKHKLAILGKLLWIGLPLVIAMAGFLLANFHSFGTLTWQYLPDDLFNAISMYLMNYQETPANLLIELARWLAPLTTAGVVLYTIRLLRKKLHNFFLYTFRRRCIAVYGNASDKAIVLSRLGKYGVDGGDEFVKAQKYILLDSEAANMEFYQLYCDRIPAKSTVYLRCRTFPNQSVIPPRVRLFDPAETAARLFWKKYCLYELSARNGHRLQIVLIGFERLGQEILLTALQDNLFHPDQQITYHVFGAAEGFDKIQYQLSEISDPVIFHQEEWYDQLSLLNEAHAIIVAKQENQPKLLRNLQLAILQTPVYVFSACQTGVELLAGNEHFIPYDWKPETLDPENILGHRLYERAMRINGRYAHLYHKVPETPEHIEAEWDKLNSFLRYSNISSADYHEIQLQILAYEHLEQELSKLPQEWMERLSELEHMRWCRYHYLFNWRFGVPQQGRKDNRLRIHADLIPYQKLTEAEKEKDRENLRVMFSIH